MTEQFTPTTEQVRNGYAVDPEAEYRDPITNHTAHGERAFDRWLAAHDAEVRASVQPPTREQIDTAVGGVLFNASNYPRLAGPHILGQDIGPLRSKVTDAVLALFPQPTPSAEPKPSLCARLQPHEAHATSFRVWAKDGYYDVPGRCPGIPAEPVSIADMAPGTRFVGRLRDGALSSTDRVWMVGNLGYVFSTENHLLTADRIDPSTIRDVTPPPATPPGGQ